MERVKTAGMLLKTRYFQDFLITPPFISFLDGRLGSVIVTLLAI
jgi:hypothetical protein